jgi:phosphopantothenoylcysteine decarboxylase/phosphopantothenate--cysteine ligase
VVEEATETPEALIFAPATADTLARLARGLGEDPAERIYAAGTRQAVVAPEMDEATGEHPAVRENAELLRKDGCRVLEGSGEEMASPGEISNAVLNALGGPLSGLRVLVTAGGTQEPIDKVRFVGNRSSGKMGRAAAREAVRRGAEVMVVAANVGVKEPGGWRRRQRGWPSTRTCSSWRLPSRTLRPRRSTRARYGGAARRSWS